MQLAGCNCPSVSAAALFGTLCLIDPLRTNFCDTSFAALHQPALSMVYTVSVMHVNAGRGVHETTARLAALRAHLALHTALHDSVPDRPMQDFTH